VPQTPTPHLSHRPISHLHLSRLNEKQKTPYRLLNRNKINSSLLFSKRTVADMTQQHSR
jgi:hypothetical protein